MDSDKDALVCQFCETPFIVEKAIQNFNSTFVYNTTINAETVTVSMDNAAALTKRGFLFLEDEKWEKAEEYFDNALDQNPEYPDAYLGAILARYNLKNKGALATCVDIEESDELLQKLRKYGSPELNSEISRLIQEAKSSGILSLKQREYERAADKYYLGHYLEAAEIYKSLNHFKDSEKKYAESMEKYTTEKKKQAQKEKERSQRLSVRSNNTIQEIKPDTKEKEEQNKQKGSATVAAVVFCIVIFYFLYKLAGG